MTTVHHLGYCGTVRLALQFCLGFPKREIWLCQTYNVLHTGEILSIAPSEGSASFSMFLTSRICHFYDDHLV